MSHARDWVAREVSPGYISYNAPLVSIDVDNSGEPVLTPKGVLAWYPDNVSNSHIAVGRVPLGPDK